MHILFYFNWWSNEKKTEKLYHPMKIWHFRTILIKLGYRFKSGRNRSTKYFGWDFWTREEQRSVWKWVWDASTRGHNNFPSNKKDFNITGTRRWKWLLELVTQLKLISKIAILIQNSGFTRFRWKKYKNLFCSSSDLVRLRPRLFPSTNVSFRKSSYSMGNFFSDWYWCPRSSNIQNGEFNIASIRKRDHIKTWKSARGN